jgi:hypothetical protein
MLLLFNSWDNFNHTHILSLTFSIAEKVTKKLEKNMLLRTGQMHGPSRLIGIFQPIARLLFELLSWLRD